MCSYRDVRHTFPLPGPILAVRLPGNLSKQSGAGSLAALYGLNPMAGVVEGFRWGLLGTGTLEFEALAINALIVSALLLGWRRVSLSAWKKPLRMLSDG